MWDLQSEVTALGYRAFILKKNRSLFMQLITSAVVRSAGGSLKLVVKKRYLFLKETHEQDPCDSVTQSLFSPDVPGLSKRRFVGGSVRFQPETLRGSDLA